VATFEQWLASLGLDKHTCTFADAEIDVDIVSELTETDLEKPSSMPSANDREMRQQQVFSRACDVRDCGTAQFVVGQVLRSPVAFRILAR
jgi:hypothetical protein